MKSRLPGQATAKPRWRARQLALALAALLAVGLPGAAAAAPSSLTVREQIDFTVLRPFLSGICGYDVYSRLDGTITIVMTFDDAGNPVREVDTGVLTQTFFAPATGQPVSFPLTVNMFADYQPDGTAVATITGLFLNVHATGDQPVRFQAGREVYSAVIIDVRPDGVPIIELIDLLLVNGVDWGALGDICLALDG
jgi:hypothetical protein